MEMGRPFFFALGALAFAACTDGRRPDDIIPGSLRGVRMNLRITGPEADGGKRRRCEILLAENGGILDRRAPLVVELHLEDDRNHLYVRARRWGLLSQPRPGWGMLDLCADAFAAAVRMRSDPDAAIMLAAAAEEFEPVKEKPAPPAPPRIVPPAVPENPVAVAPVADPISEERAAGIANARALDDTAYDRSHRGDLRGAARDWCSAFAEDPRAEYLYRAAQVLHRLGLRDALPEELRNAAFLYRRYEAASGGDSVLPELDKLSDDLSALEEGARR